MIKPRCKKCGKVLSDPESIARGIGPKCAGISSGGNTNVKFGRSSGYSYRLGLMGSAQTILPITDTIPEIQSKREHSRCSREDRRRLFDERKPFQCGLLLPERKPIIYTPTANGNWKNNRNERVIPHEQLQRYLKDYHLI